MIECVINGYYRSGTTIWQKIVQDELDVITIHEPTGPSAGYEVPYALKDHTNPHPFHKWDVYSGYRQLPRDVLFEWLKRWHYYRPKGLVSREVAMKLLEPFHKMREPVIVKTTNLLSLPPCKVINIRRKPLPTAYAHVEIFPEVWRPNILKLHSFNSAFFVDDCYRALGGRESCTVLEKILYNLQVYYYLNPPTHHFENPKGIAKSLGVSWRQAKKHLDEKKLKPKLPKWFIEMAEVYTHV